MSIPCPEPLPDELRRYSNRLPRPLSIGVATVVMVVAALGLRVGIPIDRNQLAIQEIFQADGSITAERNGGSTCGTPRSPMREFAN